MGCKESIALKTVLEVPDYKIGTGQPGIYISPMVFTIVFRLFPLKWKPCALFNGLTHFDMFNVYGVVY